MDKKDLIKNKYKEYKENHFQKRIEDEVGTRYFINITFYKFKIGNDKFHEGYELKVQFQNTYLYKKETTLNLNFEVSNYIVTQVEKIIDDQWTFLGFPYYEK